MEILRRSPSFAILAALVSGLALYDSAGAYIFVIPPLIFAGVSFCSYEFDLPGQWKIFFAGLVIIFLCSLRIYFVLSAPDMQEINFSGEAGTVTLVRNWGRGNAVVIDTENYGSLVTLRRFSEFTEGTRIIFDGSIKNFRSAKNGFDEKKYWRGRGVNARVNIRNVKEQPQEFSISLMRYKIFHALTVKVPALTADYLKAAWLGKPTDELRAKHQKWGTGHLLAVSGFHVGLMVLVITLLFGKNFIVISAFMWLYVMLTGASSSAMRAALMLQLAMIAPMFGRKSSSLNAVSLAAISLILFRPYIFWDIGLRLSVISVIALITLWENISNDKLRKILIAPAVNMAVYPQVISIFKSMPYAGFIINFFAPFYFSLALIIASSFGILALMNVPLAYNFMFIPEIIFSLVETVSDFTANIISGVMVYNIYTLSLWTGALIFLMCGYFNFSLRRTALITGLAIIAAYFL